MRAAWVVGGLFALVACNTLAAQVTVRGARRDTIVARATVTAVFAIRNEGGDTARVAPAIDVPGEWTVLVGGNTVTVPPFATELLMIGVAVPLRAPALVYPIRVAIGGSMDSALVRVPQRRGLDVMLVERPPYVVSGRAYDVTFLVRNRGNIGSGVRLRARSTLGQATLTHAAFALDAEQGRSVTVRVTAPRGIAAAVDDVLELSALPDSVGQEPAVGSSRVTVVPEPDREIERYLRVPAQVNLRAASSDAVSRFEAYGRGLVRDGGSAEVDFLFRGPTGEFSAFGERDEYRVSLRTPSWRARVGDEVYMLSPLTGAALPGFGAGLDVTRGALKAGAYGHTFRRLPTQGTEVGAFVATGSRHGMRAGLNAVQRAGSLFPGTVGSATAGMTSDALSGDLELARSQDGRRDGLARSGRLSGAMGRFSFDAGHQHADTGFSGVQRGSTHSFLSANVRAAEVLSLSFNGGTHETDASRLLPVRYRDRLDVATAGATFHNRYSVQVGAVQRATTMAALEQDAWQRSVRARGEHAFPFGDVGLEGELGHAEDFLASARAYSDVSLSLRSRFPFGAGGVWVDRYSGGSITRGTAGTFTVGGDGTLRVARGTDVSLIAYATRARGPAPAWSSQLDAMITQPLRNGSRVSLRARVTGGGTLAASDQSVAYLEYGMPLRLPVSRLRTPGRVMGRVVDAESGRGIAGALVRLGPQVAITDRDGAVAFGGVPAGEHRLSMSQETSFADAVFVGDPTVVIDSARAQPTTFRLAIARSARVDLTVRRFVSVRTGVGGAADSLADAGPLANATLVLVGERDTLYRTTREDGSAAFTDVPPGAWTLAVRGDAPAFHRFEPDRVELVLAPGEGRTLQFRLVPRKREVQVIRDGEELKSEAAGARPQPAPAGTRTRKPDEGQS